MVEELDDRAVEQALDALRAPPVGDLALGLDRRAGSGAGRALRDARSARAGERAARAHARAHAARGPARVQRAARERRPVAARAARLLLLADVAVPGVQRSSRPDARARARRARFTGLSSTSTSMPISRQRRDLVEGAVQLVVGQADRARASARWRVARRRRGGCDVDEVAGLVPGADGLDRARVGLGGEDVLVAVGLVDAGARPARAAGG